MTRPHDSWELLWASWGVRDGRGGSPLSGRASSHGGRAPTRPQDPPPLAPRTSMTAGRLPSAAATARKVAMGPPSPSPGPGPAEAGGASAGAWSRRRARTKRGCQYLISGGDAARAVGTGGGGELLHGFLRGGPTELPEVGPSSAWARKLFGSTRLTQLKPRAFPHTLMHAHTHTPCDRINPCPDLSSRFRTLG